MRLRPEQLQKQLTQTLAPVYHISGDEMLLTMEACDAIRAAARKLGFEEREIFHVETHFDWGNLIAAGSAMSLFGSRKLIELRLNKPKPDEAGNKALQEYLADPSPDNVLLITSPKIDAAIQKTAWFNAIDKTGVVVQVWPVDARELPGWVGRRLGQAGFRAGADVAQMIAARVEGNLLAAAQEVQKLALLFDQGAALTVADVERAVADSSRYTVFDLADRALAGDGAGALKVLRGLQGEGEEPTLILWSLAREVRLLAALNSNPNTEAVFREQRVFDKRKPLLQNASRRFSAPTLTALAQLAYATDQAIKGQLREDPWLKCEQLVLGLCGTPAL
jgi:DNA polymerase-3 subunit delta